MTPWPGPPLNWPQAAPAIPPTVPVAGTGVAFHPPFLGITYTNPPPQGSPAQGPPFWASSSSHLSAPGTHSCPQLECWLTALHALQANQGPPLPSPPAPATRTPLAWAPGSSGPLHTASRLCCASRTPRTSLQGLGDLLPWDGELLIFPPPDGHEASRQGLPEQRPWCGLHTDPLEQWGLSVGLPMEPQPLNPAACPLSEVLLPWLRNWPRGSQLTFQLGPQRWLGPHRPRPETT